MLKKTGLAIVAIMLLLGSIPILGAADPTRDTMVEIVGISIKGETGPGGEFSSGTHEISAVLNNSGNENFLNTTTLYLKIFHSNTSEFYNTSKEFFPPIDANSEVELVIDTVDMPEGEYYIVVNGTIDGVEKTFMREDVVIMDVVDLSMDSDFFIPDGEYPPGEELIPTCQVTYEGNVDSWNDDVVINLTIELLETPLVVVYGRNMTIMVKGQATQDPGHIFSVIFDEGWTPETPGNYRAKFSVDYDTYNTSNNMKTVFFSIDQLPSIEGWVQTTLGTPVQNVTVNLRSTFLIGQVFTDADGYYFFEDVVAETYALEFIKMWSTSNTTSVNVEEGVTSVVNATVNKQAIGGLRGQVKLPDGTPAEGVEITVQIPGEAPLIDYTDSFGNYSFASVKAGTIEVIGSLEGYLDAADTNFTLIEQIWNELDMQIGEIPFTVTFSPPDNEPGFPVDETISLQFSRPINTSTTNESTIYIIDLSTSQNVPLSFAFIEDENTVLLSPQSGLVHLRKYRITVTELVEDINGHYFPLIAYSNFTTMVEIQEIDIESRYPAYDQSEVPVDVRISAVFPEPMDVSTISESTFQVFLSGGGGSPIAGTVVYYSENYTAEFIPLDDLEYGGMYSVSLDEDIEPLDPYKIFGGNTWSFSTMALVTTGSVVGFILDEDGEPFSPNLIKATIQLGTGAPMSLLVGLDGKFEEAELAEGEWTLTIEIPDHKTLTTVFTIAAGHEVDLTSLTVEKEDEDSIWNPGFIAMIIVVLLIIVILAYVFLGRKQKEPEEEEETGRGRSRPGFAHERPQHMERDHFDDLPEGEFMCPVCGYVVESDEPDCPNCGAEFEEDLFECPECGSMVPGDSLECPDCGAKFEDDELSPEDEDDLYGEEEEEDITEEYEVDELDEDDLPIRDME